jgi:hypothetical protein
MVTTDTLETDRKQLLALMNLCLSNSAKLPLLIALKIADNKTLII